MNTNEPAFPTLHSIDGNWVREPKKELQGLTKREYFAVMAMQGILAAKIDISYDDVAIKAVTQADALLKYLGS